MYILFIHYTRNTHTLRLDEKFLSNIFKIQKSQKLNYILYLGNVKYSLKNVLLTKSPTPLNRPTNRGGVYFSDTFVFKIRATVNDLSIVPLLSHSMLGPNPEFQELEIRTKMEIRNSLKEVSIFAHLTNSMQSSSHIELNMTITGIEST